MSQFVVRYNKIAFSLTPIKPFTAATQAEAMKNYFAEMGVKISELQVVGCDGEATNTGWRVSLVSVRSVELCHDQ